MMEPEWIVMRGAGVEGFRFRISLNDAQETLTMEINFTKRKISASCTESHIRIE